MTHADWVRCDYATPHLQYQCKPQCNSTAAPIPPRVERAAALPHPDVSLLLFAGKGGVGKTTLASATAFRLAEEYPDREIFLISSRHSRHS
jgi:DNA polymerase III delta prime subunit